MGHGEELDLVAGVPLEGGDVVHVGLGAAAAVEELVDVEDAHGDPCGTDPECGLGSDPRVGPGSASEANLCRP